jgi:EAL domain-containing protein (putative c-di-GMP-specific phosphodiesterase class I)
MGLAVEWVEDLCSDLLMMSWRQVRSLVDDRQPEHLTGRLAKLGPDGSAVTQRSAEFAMRRLGMGSILDHEVIARCLISLARELSEPVAVEISMQTLTTDFPMLEHLLNNFDEDVVRRIRLTIKSDSKDRRTEPREFIEFARRRGITFGTKIVLSNASSWLPIFQSSPDFVVIPGAIVRSAISDPDNIMALSKIGALASLVSPKVIAEGVDCALLAKHARDAGLEWGQGHFLGRTSWSRTLGNKAPSEAKSYLRQHSPSSQLR